MAELQTSAHEQHFVYFLPFLRLDKPYSIGGFSFVLLTNANGGPHPGLEAAVEPISRILSGYIDRNGKGLTNCVVVTTADRGWDLSLQDGPAVMWAASLLFFASWARNDYYPRWSRRYVNSVNFRVIGQSFQGKHPNHIAVSARRRDGNILSGGYKHCAFKFSVPIQCSLGEPANVDEGLLRDSIQRTPRDPRH